MAQTSFQVRTYWKLDKGEYGLTQLFSVRLPAAKAIGFILLEFPEESVNVKDENGTTTIVIDWNKVPDGLRNPVIPVRSK